MSVCMAGHLLKWPAIQTGIAWQLPASRWLQAQGMTSPELPSSCPVSGRGLPPAMQSTCCRHADRSSTCILC